MSMLQRTADGRMRPRTCYPKPCQSGPAEAKTAEDVLRLTLEAMERNNIVLGFLSSASLEDTYQWLEAAPGRFIASPSVGDPDLIDLNDLRKEYESGRLGGMGELGIQYAGIAVGDSRVTPFFALAEEFDVPVLIHHHGTGGPSDQFRISLGHPEQLEEVLIRHPRLRIFIETSGFPYLEETIALMYRYPNVYGDLSLWKYPAETANWYLRSLVQAGLGKRLMFGSDQVQWPEVIEEMIDLIESADYLSEEQKRDIFYNNAARFLGLSEDEIAQHHRR
jgi:predicted TIM-barrel fold metal-dependent hydrolase